MQKERLTLVRPNAGHREAALQSNAPSVRTIEKNGGRGVCSFDFYGQTADVFEVAL